MHRYLGIGIVVVALAGGAASVFAWKALRWRQSLVALKASSKDLAGIGVHARENAAITSSGRRPDVVFLGASHTLDWGELGGRFPGIDAVNRGIGGQLVPQYLLRFRQDVLELRPRVVVVEGCAINATYDVPVRVLADSYESMIELARAHDIEPILATNMPVGRSWEERLPGTNARVRRINEEIRKIAAARGCRVVDYHEAVADPGGYLPSSFSNDGMHCSPEAYDRLALRLEPLLREVLGPARSAMTPAPPHP